MQAASTTASKATDTADSKQAPPPAASANTTQLPASVTSIKPTAQSPLGLSRSNCVYTSCYCEENVWWLCESLRLYSATATAAPAFDMAHVYAVFVSNPSRTVPLWKQRGAELAAGAEPPTDDFVIWDYVCTAVTKVL
jgi:hypothetical protein